MYSAPGYAGPRPWERPGGTPQGPAQGPAFPGFGLPPGQQQFQQSPMAPMQQQAFARQPVPQSGRSTPWQAMAPGLPNQPQARPPTITDAIQQPLPQQPLQPTAGEGIPQVPFSVTKVFKPYFTKAEVQAMGARQAGSVAIPRVLSTREQACIFMDRVGVRLGFPRRTIATAQLLYHRFHLYFPIQDFSPFDVSLSCLLLSCKLEDTLKKLREIQVVGWQVRNYVSSNGTAAENAEPDPAAIEADKVKYVGLERLLLETVCFDFGAGRTDSEGVPGKGKDAFAAVVELGRQMGASKAFIKVAFRIVIDSYRTLVGLSHQPHVIALAALFLASFIDPDHPNSRPQDVSAAGDAEVKLGTPAFPPGWEQAYNVDIADIEEITLAILDLFEYAFKQVPVSSRPAKSIISPASPASPKDVSTPTSTGASGTVATAGTDRAEEDLAPSTTAVPRTFDELSQLQIRLRQHFASRLPASDASAEGRKRKAEGGESVDGTPQAAKRSNVQNPVPDVAAEVLGRDDVTVRFVFGGETRPAEVPSTPVVAVR